MTITVGIIPFSFIILLHYNFALKEKLEKASEINRLIKARSDPNHGKRLISIESNNLNESLELPVKSLFYIASADNYVDVCYLNNDVIKRKLLRNTLRNIDMNFSNIPEIIRCHKSYIVNTMNVESIRGNSAGYKLLLRGVDFSIPLSRRYNESILNIFSKRK
jgi:DNA-binding LytR/AlgR family response regulator